MLVISLCVLHPWLMLSEVGRVRSKSTRSKPSERDIRAGIPGSVTIERAEREVRYDRGIYSGRMSYYVAIARAEELFTSVCCLSI